MARLKLAKGSVTLNVYSSLAGVIHSRNRAGKDMSKSRNGMLSRDSQIIGRCFLPFLSHHCLHGFLLSKIYLLERQRF